MLKLAVSACMPVIEVTTRDTLNLIEVIKAVTGKTPVNWDNGPTSIPEKKLFYLLCKKDTPPISDGTYNKLAMAESTLLVVNPAKPSPVAFKAGEVPVPRKLVAKFLRAIVDSESKALDLVPALGGCTLKEAAEIARLTMAATGGLTRQGLSQTRKSCFQGPRGLTQVDTHQWSYIPAPGLQAWLEGEREAFLDGEDARLIPRGLLFDGPPGVGKTEGAKWLAAQMGVPLYRVDVGTTMEKWVGASEENFRSLLSQLDNEEPCVALFDEIEKVFGRGVGEADAGTSTRMQSQLLWWLAEHRSRVLVVMTTNAIRRLPPELYREGRIDEVFVFEGLALVPAVALGKQLLATFPTGKQVTAGKLTAALQHKLAATAGTVISHAAVTKTVYGLIKQVQSK